MPIDSAKQAQEGKGVLFTVMAVYMNKVAYIV